MLKVRARAQFELVGVEAETCRSGPRWRTGRGVGIEGEVGSGVSQRRMEVESLGTGREMERGELGLGFRFRIRASVKK